MGMGEGGGVLAKRRWYTVKVQRATGERVWVLRVKGLEMPPFGVKMPP